MAGRVDRDRIGEAMTAAIGDAAGSVVDPGTALTPLRSKLSSPAVIAVGAGFVIGYLLGRRAGR